MESKKEIATALSKLIAEVGPIIKQMDVSMGGTNTYKAVSDKDVKEKVGKKMSELGLSIVPVSIEPRETINNYTDNYGKPKTSVFTSVTVKYLLLHSSGESIEVVGYGHGLDTQDKAAGKATTYALKYLLLYLSLAPTGSEDDFSEHRPEDMSPTTVVPPATPQKTQPAQTAQSAPKPNPQQSVSTFESEKKEPAKQDDKIVLKVGDDSWGRLSGWITSNKGKGDAWIFEKVDVKYTYGDDVKQAIKALLV